ncbi:hypothetical protein K491DRAFT_22199 [Lophiostoma macrostomum CBS 122681]|uniref:F-box domain-containing protein n=1 Tax=Lophiostoma macrostomum CBS 122681 TaxID=1314788 RepID=A0A6A6T3D4_9PLEO|nr:hypothetical protein K491DRAFT_22199 [Lophiostoma macrostomum CBS 122681]
MAGLLDLPKEILDMVCVELQTSSPRSLWAMALTCKQLSMFLDGRLYKEVSLLWSPGSRSSLAKFARAHQDDLRVQALRIQPSRRILNSKPYRSGSGHGDRLSHLDDITTASTHLRIFCVMLPTLENLTTVSIYTDDVQEGSAWLSGPFLANILRALPLLLSISR